MAPHPPGIPSRHKREPDLAQEELDRAMAAAREQARLPQVKMRTKSLIPRDGEKWNPRGVLFLVSGLVGLPLIATLAANAWSGAPMKVGQGNNIEAKIDESLAETKQLRGEVRELKLQVRLYQLQVQTQRDNESAAAIIRDQRDRAIATTISLMNGTRFTPAAPGVPGTDDFDQTVELRKRFVTQGYYLTSEGWGVMPTPKPLPTELPP